MVGHQDHRTRLVTNIRDFPLELGTGFAFVGSQYPLEVGREDFCLSVVDDLVRDAEHDQPSVGILLCRDRNRVVAEYALRDLNKPLGVSTYLTDELPKQLAQRLADVDAAQHADA